MGDLRHALDRHFHVLCLFVLVMNAVAGAISHHADLVDALQHLFAAAFRSEEHTSELQSLRHLVCRLLLEKKKQKKKKKQQQNYIIIQ